METMSVTFVEALLVLVAWLPLVLGFSSAFLWSPHLNGMKETVDYHILSSRELANYAMTKGAWPKYLCSEEEAEETTNFVLLFVGKELQSMDVSRSVESDQVLVGFLKNYLDSGMKKVSGGHTYLVLLCNGGFLSSRDIDLQSESSNLSQILVSISRLGAKYSILYVSDPVKSTSYLARHELGRFLAECATSNTSANSNACDAVCQIKSSLLEGILVGIVLLVILILGLCCMMGIDTPTRFKTPQDS